MNAADVFAALTRRLATATSISRSRREDAEREVRHGGSVAELNARIEAALPDVQAAIAKAEKV